MSNSNTDNFKWDEQKAKDLCEYVGLRVGKNKDIKQQIDLLTQDFKATHTEKKEESGRDWEIIELDHYLVGLTSTYTLKSPGYYQRGTSVLPFSWFESKNLTIKKVRRLSDNEVFSINDYVHSYGWEINMSIRSFSIDKNEMKASIWFEDKEAIVPISSLSKPASPKEKEPLFHDTLGNPVYEGDSAWGVNTNCWTIELYHPSRCTEIDCMKYFKNQSDAKEYCFNNRPILSYEDVKSIFGERDFIGTEFFLSHAKELIQSKLKQQ